MISLDLFDKNNNSVAVDIYHLDENNVKVVVDEDNELTVNFNLFKHRQRFEDFCFKFFDKEEVEKILWQGVYTGFEDNEDFSLWNFNESSKQKVQKFKDNEN